MKLFLIVLTLFIVSPKAQADQHQALVHGTAHIGASYTLQTVFYGFNSRVLEMSKPRAQLTSLVATLLVGYAYKLHSPGGLETSMGQNAIGAGLAIGTHWIFEF